MARPRRNPRHDGSYVSPADVTPSPFAGGDWFDPLEEAVRLQVRGFIEELLEEELEAALGCGRYERSGAGKGHRHGRRTRQLVTTSVRWGCQCRAAGCAMQRASVMEERVAASLQAAQPSCRSPDRPSLPGRHEHPPGTQGMGSLFAGHVGKEMVSRAWRRTRSAWETWQRRDLADEAIVRLILDGTSSRSGSTGRPPLQ